VPEFTVPEPEPEPTQELPTKKHPPVRVMPFENVEVAPEERLIEPPVIVRPLVEERPPALIEAMPPANVEVALSPLIVVVAVEPMKRVSSIENLVEEALMKVWSPVQLLGLERLSPTVLAVPPLYASENVRVLSVAVRPARSAPRAMPLMVEFWSSALLMEALGRMTLPPVTVRPLEEARPAEDIPPAKVEVAVEVAMILENSLYPLDVKFLEAREPRNVEVAVVEVALRERKVGVIESTSLNWWSAPEEVMTREVFCPADVEKVWVTALRPFNVEIPEPAAPEPRHTPREV